MNVNYAWIPFYEAAVLETDPELLLSRIEAAQNAIGQRVIKLGLDANEKHAIVKTLNALTVLKRERSRPANSPCGQCKDANNPVTFVNGKKFLAKIPSGELFITLHTMCIDAWARENNCQALVPFPKARPHNEAARRSGRWHTL